MFRNVFTDIICKRLRTVRGSRAKDYIKGITMIIENNNFDQKWSVNRVAARKVITGSRKRKGRMTEAEQFAYKRDMDLLTIIDKQLRKSRALYLNNESVALQLGCTVTEAHKAKKRLSNLDIIYIPAYGRQKPGKSSIWLLNLPYMVTKYVDNKTGKPKRTRKPDSLIYTTEFCTIKSNVAKDLREQFEWEEKEYGTKVVVSSSYFWMSVNQIVSQELAELGKSRDDYRL